MSKKRTSRRRNSGKYYTSGANAIKTQEARDNASLKYLGRQIKKEESIKRVASLKKLLMMSVICSCCILIVFFKAMTYGLHRENISLRNELDAQIYQTETITEQTASIADPRLIEEYAINNLNMSRPQAYQIVYIEVPKSDFTVHHGASLLHEKERVSVRALIGHILPGGNQ